MRAALWRSAFYIPAYVWRPAYCKHACLVMHVEGGDVVMVVGIYIQA